MPLIRKVMIINLIIVSTLWAFIIVWGGSTKAIKKCKTLLKFFQWSSGEHQVSVKSIG
jgi:hypothetical protein